MNYIIIKHVKIENNIELPVILIDSLGEVLYFKSRNDAEFYLSLFQRNSDSNHRYEIKSLEAASKCECGAGCGCS